MEIAAIVLDVALLIFFLIFAIVGFRKGFFRSLVGIVSVVLAVFVAIYCSPFIVKELEEIFSVCTNLANSLAEKFSATEGYNAIYSEEAVKTLVTNLGVPSFLSGLVISLIGNISGAESITAGEAVTSSLASLIVNAICVVALFILCVFLLWLISKLFTKLLDSIPVLGAANRILGMVLELAKGLIILYVVLMIVGLIPFEVIQNAIDSTVVLKVFRDYNLITFIISNIPALNEFIQSLTTVA